MLYFLKRCNLLSNKKKHNWLEIICQLFFYHTSSTYATKMELSRKDFRAMIFYDFKSSLSPQECAARLQNAFGREAPWLSTVRQWFVEFDRGRVSLHDEFREGRPSTAVNENNVATVKRLIKKNPRITLSLSHSAHSPDLALCDFCIFPKIKDLMRGFTFTNSEEAVIAFNQHVDKMPPDLWSSSFKKWFERMKKCLKCKM